MNINFNAEISNPHVLLTKAGYHAHYNGSYVSRLGSGDFPRFHIYITKKNETINLSLHLDQSKPIYYNQKAHRGEKDSTVVIEESERIKRWIKYYSDQYGSS